MIDVKSYGETYMKKIGLLCSVALITLGLAGCSSSNSSAKSSSSSNKSTSSKVVRKHKHNTSKRSSTNNNATSPSIKKEDGQQTSASNTNGNQADPYDVSTWDKPYGGYPSFRAYLNAHPDTPNIQQQTADMQHSWNQQHGIENADGSETTNFRKWVAARDWQWQQGNTNFPDYDPNHDWTTGLPY